jgi:hypothetical protein
MRLYHVELTDSGVPKDHLNNLILNNLSSATTLKKRLNPEDEQPFGFHPKDLSSRRVKLTDDKALRIYQDHNTLTFSQEDLAVLSKLH